MIDQVGPRNTLHSRTHDTQIPIHAKGPEDSAAFLPCVAARAPVSGLGPKRHDVICSPVIATSFPSPAKGRAVSGQQRIAMQTKKPAH